MRGVGKLVSFNRLAAAGGRADCLEKKHGGLAVGALGQSPAYDLW